MALLLGAVIIAAFVVLGGDAAAEGPSAVPNSEAAQTSEAASVDKIEIYIVQPGDTLWGIAHDIAVPGQDVNQLMDVLKSAAGTSDLDIGQRLVVDHSLVGG